MNDFMNIMLNKFLLSRKDWLLLKIKIILFLDVKIVYKVLYVILNKNSFISKTGPVPRRAWVEDSE